MFTSRKIRFVFATAAVVAAAIALALVLRDAPSEDMTTLEKRTTKLRSDQYPVVEYAASPGLTVMTLQTDDPHIKVVWFFDENFRM